MAIRRSCLFYQTIESTLPGVSPRAINLPKTFFAMYDCGALPLAYLPAASRSRPPPALPLGCLASRFGSSCRRCWLRAAGAAAWLLRKKARDKGRGQASRC
jgi:hypothetical protein